MDLQQQEWWAQYNNDTNAVLLDVRTDEEVMEKRIANALHVDFYGGQAFLDTLQTLDKSKNYYVYCRSGNRSGQACLLMKQLGFGEVFNLVGGMNEWEGPIEE